MTDINPIIEYNQKIQRGEVTACRKIKILYRYLAEIITNDEEWYYDADYADYVIDFIECFCKHSKGKWANQAVKLELWQKAVIASIYGIKNKKTKERRFKEVFFVVGKKNGKSLLASVLSLFMLVGDGEGGAEVYSVGTKREQAKIIWRESRSMILKSSALRKRVKCLNNSLEFLHNDSFFKPLSADSNTEDGLNVYMAACDEIHAWKGIRGTALYNIVYNGTSSRDEPLVLAVTTGGFERDGIFDLKYELSERVINGYFDSNGFKKDSFLPVIYELDNRDEWLDKDCWIKANPNLGISKKVQYLKERVELAQEFPHNKKDVLCKEFNIRETSEDVWMSFEEIYNEETFDIRDLKPSYCIGGADLSKNTDLTGGCIMFILKDKPYLYFENMYWLPKDMLRKRTSEDQIPYDTWYEQGYLRLSQGNKVDYDDVVSWFMEIQTKYDCYLFDHGYDAWSATAYIKKMNDNFGDIGHAVHQGKKTLSSPMLQLGAEIKSKNVIYNNNPITKWCLTNVRADYDKNGNVQPAKTNNQRRRIDGFAAMLNAYTRYLEIREDYQNIL